MHEVAVGRRLGKVERRPRRMAVDRKPAAVHGQQRAAGAEPILLRRLRGSRFRMLELQVRPLRRCIDQQVGGGRHARDPEAVAAGMSRRSRGGHGGD